MLSDYLPLFLMMVLAGGLAFTMLKMAEILGPKRPNVTKESAYESGMDPIGSARDRYSVRFYLIAMIFIVFDVEVVFMYPWAATFREFIDMGIGLGVLGVITIFIDFLSVGVCYERLESGVGLYW